MIRIGEREFNTANRTYVMGILNVTPDSFSDGGMYSNMDAVLRRVEIMIREGADIIDVGGESTRPGFTEISSEEEMGRVIPVIEKIKKNFEIPISLDTSKAAVAQAGILSGANMINDITGLQGDGSMAKVIAKAQVPCVIMHNRVNKAYQDFWKELCQDLEAYIQTATDAGIEENRIIIDPGVGFAKTQEQNLEVMRRLEELGALGYPILLGVSRKSVIGNVLSLPVGERLEGTLATTVLAVAKGCSFVRVHDIKENVRAVKMAEAVLYK